MSASWLDQELVRWAAGAIAAALIATAAWRARALAPSGVVAAIVVGAIMVGGGGWWAGVLLVTFFVASSGLSRAGKRPEGHLLQARGSRRDAVQVLANGGVAAACALAFAGTSHASWIVALAASLAAANADTWATEIGRLSGQRPRSIVTFRSVPSGTSGGISFAGTIASFAGAVFLGIVALIGWSNHWLANPAADTDVARLLMIVTGTGFLGAFADSILGATIQAQYHCPACDKATESPVHSCGTRTTPVRGVRWITNDVVNIAAIVVATAIALWLATGLG
ncbi:MAG: DUF92 domain-containing protein [Thermomicrobiales bacterium]